MRLFIIVVIHYDGDTVYYNVAGNSIEHALSIIRYKVRNIKKIDRCTDQGELIVDDRENL